MIQIDLTLNEETLAKLAGVDSEELLIRNVEALSNSEVKLEILVKGATAKTFLEKIEHKEQVEKQLLKEKKKLSELQNKIKELEAQISYSDQIFTTDDKGNLSVEGNDEFKEAKNKNLEEAIKPHDTEKGELEQLNDILEDVTKFFNSPVLIGKKEIREGLKSKGFNLL